MLREEVLRGKGNLIFKLSEQLLLELADSYGTPYFLMDEATIRRKAEELRDAYSTYIGKVSIAYSVKANFTPRVLKVYGEEGMLFDTATVEELYFVERAVGRASESVYTSVTQTYEEFRRALDHGVRLFVVGSMRGLWNLERAADRAGRKVDVLIRINPEVGYRPNSKRFYLNGKFGVPVRDPSGESGEKLVESASRSSSLRIRGFHFHVGTQVTEPEMFVNAIDRIEELVRSRSWLDVGIVDIGGGMPVSYDYGIPSARDISRSVVERLNELARRLGRAPDLIVESGRFLVAEAGVLASRVLNIKNYSGKLYAYLDTGYHNLLDAVLVRQVYPVRVVPAGGGSTNKRRVVLAGMLCDMDDVFPLGRMSIISGLDIGKLVVFGNVGAYSTVFNMPFHSQPKPPILFRNGDGNVEVARPRESLDALYREEGGY